MDALIEIAKYIGWGFGFMYIVWFFYLAVMNLIKAKDEGHLRWQAAILGYPIAIVGVLLDMALNIIVGTILFLELPELKKLLLTARLQKHCGEPNWRGSVARWICHNLLDPFDPGGVHCKCDTDNLPK